MRPIVIAFVRFTAIGTIINQKSAISNRHALSSEVA
jgi:hypothetical protein